MHALKQLMRSVVRIETTFPSGTVATGSGFTYSFAAGEDEMLIPTIVTNKHVIEDAVSISLPISTVNASGDPTGRFEVITYPITSNRILWHPDPEVDLCAVLIAPIYEYFRKKEENPFLVLLDKSIVADTVYFDELLPLEEVTMFGFPNGIWDSANNGAIARRGIIATNPSDDYLGKKQFVVDMACYPGSSGSPIFLTDVGHYSDRTKGIVVFENRIKLLGILYAGPQHRANGEIVIAPIPTHNVPMSTMLIPNNLGYVIKATELEALERIAKELPLKRSDAHV